MVVTPSKVFESDTSESEILEGNFSDEETDDSDMDDLNETKYV